MPYIPDIAKWQSAQLSARALPEKVYTSNTMNLGSCIYLYIKIAQIAESADVGIKKFQSYAPTLAGLGFG